jgi:hypothetical protein
LLHEAAANIATQTSSASAALLLNPVFFASLIIVPPLVFIFSRPRPTGSSSLSRRTLFSPVSLPPA